MISIQFPADRKDLALIFGEALKSIGTSEGDCAALPHISEEVDSTSEVPVEPEVGGLAEGLFQTEHIDVGHQTVVMQGKESELEVKKDPKGVMYNSEMCANTAKPFYASGPRKGQWKKKQKVTDAQYDAWYTKELHKVTSSTAATDTPIVDVSAAFTTSKPTSNEPPPPKDLGALMLWVSQRQSEGVLSQEDVTEAWNLAGIESPSDLLGEGAEPLIFNVYTQMKAMVA